MCVHVSCVPKIKTHRLRTEATLRLNGPQRTVENAGNILAKLVCPGICVGLTSCLRACPQSRVLEIQRGSLKVTGLTDQWPKVPTLGKFARDQATAVL
jgi:hypothetical protein